jgi:xanthosine utilization system XapX-like protein
MSALFAALQSHILDLASCSIPYDLRKEDFDDWARRAAPRVPYTITWKGTPSGVDQKYYGNTDRGGENLWIVKDEPCETKFRFTRRAVGGNPFLLVGSRAESTLDLDLTNDNLLVEILMTGFTLLMQEHLFLGDRAKVVKLVYEEMDLDYAIRAVQILSGVATMEHRYWFDWRSASDMRDYFRAPPPTAPLGPAMGPPIGKSFVVSSKSNTLRLIPDHCYSVRRCSERTVSLRSPWGRNDIEIEYEALLGDLDNVVAFVPTSNSAPHKSAATTATSPSNECAPSYPRDNYVFQYWDILLSITLIVYVFALNGPKYAFQNGGIVNASAVLRMLYVPLLFLFGICVSASAPSLYLPGQHLLLTLVSFALTGISIDQLVVVIYPLERTYVSCFASTGLVVTSIFGLMSVLDTANHVTGTVGFILGLLLVLVGNHVCKFLWESLLLSGADMLVMAELLVAIYILRFLSRSV